MYRIDPEFNKLKTRTHQTRAEGTKNPNNIKNLIGLEYSHFIIGAYDIKVPSGWMVSIPEENNWVCLYQYNKFALYLEAFKFEIRLSFNTYVKDIFNYFRLAPSQITPNSWRIIIAFEAICFHLDSHPTAQAFHYFFYLKRRDNN